MDFYYKGIRECNIFYAECRPLFRSYCDKGRTGAMESTKSIRTRLLLFYDDAYLWAGLLTGDELLDFTASTEDLYRPRNTWDECVNYVVSEMEACINDPAMAENYSDAEKDWQPKVLVRLLSLV